MKRELLCLPCGEKLRPALLPCAPGEYVKFVRGALKHACYCDNCMREMEAGSGADALSIWSDSIPYLTWEMEFFV
jgi:hypothetical protein